MSRTNAHERKYCTFSTNKSDLHDILIGNVTFFCHRPDCFNVIPLFLSFSRSLLSDRPFPVNSLQPREKYNLQAEASISDGNIYRLTFVSRQAHMILQRDLLSAQTTSPRDMLDKCTALTKRSLCFKAAACVVVTLDSGITGKRGVIYSDVHYDRWVRETVLYDERQTFCDVIKASFDFVEYLTPTLLLRFTVYKSF